MKVKLKLVKANPFSKSTKTKETETQFQIHVNQIIKMVGSCLTINELYYINNYDLLQLIILQQNLGQRSVSITVRQLLS